MWRREILCVKISDASDKSVRRILFCLPVDVDVVAARFEGRNLASVMPTIPHPAPSSRILSGL